MEPRMRFGDAIEALQASMNDEDSTPAGLEHGQRPGSGIVACRDGWNGKGMFICLMPAVEIPAQAVNARSRRYVPTGPLRVRPYLCMVDAHGFWCPGWLASQADMLADDWRVCRRDEI